MEQIGLKKRLMQSFVLLQEFRVDSALFSFANKSRYSDTKVVEGPAISRVTEFGLNDTSVAGELLRFIVYGHCRGNTVG
jgi:hypothetical protein